MRSSRVCGLHVFSLNEFTLKAAEIIFQREIFYVLQINLKYELANNNVLRMNHLPCSWVNTTTYVFYLFFHD